MPTQRKRTTRRRRRIVAWISALLGTVALLVGGGFASIYLWSTHQFPAASGEPVVGEWYGIYPDGATNAFGEQYHGLYRVGSQNNVLIYFNGGGVSVDSYTEERSSEDGASESFYNASPNADNLATIGITGQQDENPFKNWTVVVFPYSTGDFHSGAGINEVERSSGDSRSVHHSGYSNFDLVMDELAPLVGSPEKLVVAGSSAGGFGAALLADNVANRFSSTENLTVVVDSSLLLYDKWHEVALDVWKTPPAIADALHSNNITLDSLQAAQAKHPEMKVLFASSTRDNALVQYQSYLDGHRFEASTGGGERYEDNLRRMVDEMTSTLANSGVYIFEGIADGTSKLTQHTLLVSNPFDPLVGTVSPAQWIYDAVNGDVASHGTGLL
jgi:hypothetical protein